MNDEYEVLVKLGSPEEASKVELGYVVTGIDRGTGELIFACGKDSPGAVLRGTALRRAAVQRG